MKTWQLILIGAAIGAAFAGTLKTFPGFSNVNGMVNPSNPA
jgi:hypothetical protein